MDEKKYIANYNKRAVNPMWPSKYQYHVRYTMRWRTRLLMEHEANPGTFITLTYAPGVEPQDRLKTRPPQKPSNEELREVIKTDLKNFWQAIRNASNRGKYVVKRNGLAVYGSDGKRQYCPFPKIDKSSFRYYAVTERGSEEFTQRLHVHAIIFGWPNNPASTLALWSFWPFGRIDVEPLNGTRINYVTKYIHKRVHAPEFVSLKSNGIGLSWLTDERKQSFLDRRSFAFHIDGKAYFLSAYLKKKVFTDEELLKELNAALIDEILQKRQEAAEKEFSTESPLCKFFLAYRLWEFEYDSKLDQMQMHLVTELNECDVGKYVHFRDFEIDEQVRYPRMLNKRI